MAIFYVTWKPTSTAISILRKKTVSWKLVSTSCIGVGITLTKLIDQMKIEFLIQRSVSGAKATCDDFLLGWSKKIYCSGLRRRFEKCDS